MQKWASGPRKTNTCKYQSDKCSISSIDFYTWKCWEAESCISLGSSWILNSYSASHDNWCTETLWNRRMTAQCEGMGEVGSARYEPALLPPCLSIRVLCTSNCQRSNHSSSRAWQCKCYPKEGFNIVDLIHPVCLHKHHVFNSIHSPLNADFTIIS